jgi:hypothetical protein
MGALVLLLVGLGGTGSAWAHEGEETARASESIRQAIAYIVNDPENMDAIVDKVEDSLRADDTSAVKLELVRRAQSALERDEMMRARRLLERAIGARSDMAGTDVRPVLQVPPGSSTTPLAVGSETGTSVVTDEMPGRGSLTGADIVLLGFAGVLGIADALLSVRLRPPDSVRALRRRARLAGRS